MFLTSVFDMVIFRKSKIIEVVLGTVINFRDCTIGDTFVMFQLWYSEKRTRRRRRTITKNSWVQTMDQLLPAYVMLNNVSITSESQLLYL